MNDAEDFSAEQQALANAAIDDLGNEIEFQAYPVPDLREELAALHEVCTSAPAFVFHGEGPRFLYTILAVPKIEEVIGLVQ